MAWLPTMCTRASPAGGCHETPGHPSGAERTLERQMVAQARCRRVHGEDAEAAIDRGGERRVAGRDDGCLGLAAAHRRSTRRTGIRPRVTRARIRTLVGARPVGIARVDDEQPHLVVEGCERGIRVVDDLHRESRLAHELGERRARLSERMPRVAVSPASTHDDRLGHARLLVCLLPAWHGSSIAAEPRGLPQRRGGSSPAVIARSHRPRSSPAVILCGAVRATGRT